MSELKPCPFCGGDDVCIERYGNNCYSTVYMCNECGATLETSETFNHGTQWNTRPPMQDYAEEMYHTLDSILCTIKLGEAQNGNGQLGRYKNSIEPLLAKARGEQ